MHTSNTSVLRMRSISGSGVKQKRRTRCYRTIVLYICYVLTTIRCWIEKRQL